MSDSSVKLPSDVFCPGKIPIRENNVYAPRTRENAQERFSKALTRAHVPIVFGEYGVGKTSMVRFVLKEDEEAGRLVNIESVAGKTLQDVFARCLEKLQYSVEVKRTEASSSARGSESSGQASAGIGWLNALIASKRTRQETSANGQEFQIVVTSPTDSKLFELFEEAALALVLDELHKAQESFSIDLANFIKAYGNANCRRFRVVLLGTSSEATKLVQIDPGIDRLVQEVHLRAMDESEARYVVEKGMSDLEIECAPEIRNRLVRVCVGSPNILQYLCLEAAEAAFKRAPKALTHSDVEEAITDYVESREARLYTKYKAAIETFGDKRYRKQILRAVAECEDEYVTMEDIRVRVSAYLGEDVPSTALSGPLRSLKEQQFGKVLKDVDRPDKVGRITNYTVFEDPSLKAFVRLLVLREQDLHARD